MKPTLKPVSDQVIVITGASSGIGLATARLAAKRGASVVLGGRSAGALADAVAAIRASGGKAAFAAGDVANPDDVAKLAACAIETFGGIDTWVNNAGVTAFGRVADMPLDDMRRLFDVNFWGLVLGTREADQHLRTRGGAIINIGSELSERAIPLQGFYSASKHAVKGFTEAFRSELEEVGAPVSVTLVKPGPIDTPYTLNGKNYLASEPQHVPIVYAPEVVARTILRAAETPMRDVFIGGSSRLVAAIGHLAPGLTDKMMARFVIPGTESGRQPHRARDRSGLDVATEAARTRGNYPGMVRETSLYTAAVSRPKLTAGTLIGLTLVLRAAWRALPHGAARFAGRKGARALPKGLHILLEARRGREADVVQLVSDIRGSVEVEPGTLPWFGLRRNKRMFEIFETFPNEAARKRHLAGEGARALLARSNTVLRRPARITRLDVIEAKAGG